ncbi:MAG: hypothetical protein CFE34_08755 [Rhodobacteraceae bacterium PARR1]|nr:MAG: hypothetical protein CFE34_08755 [Rhodobacteraceae bacterium PARR1]
MPGTMTLTPMPTDGAVPMTTHVGAEAYLISDWPAVQTGRVIWSPANVIFQDDGSFDLALTAAPEGSWRPYLSGEVASVDTGTYGVWTWNAQVPRMVSGAVFGMFTFQADASDPRVEFDFEFVGADTTQLELNVHMAGPDGKNVSLAGGPLTVDLGFDAALALHSYAVTVTEGAAAFTIDGKVVAVFGPEDMTNGIWREGAMRSYVDLWAVSNDGIQNWAGIWDGSGVPMQASIGALEVPDGLAVPLPELPPDLPPVVPEPDPVAPVHSDTPSTAGSPPVDPVPSPLPGLQLGTEGADALTGNRGTDVLLGGAGNDTLAGGRGDDVLDGGAGTDWLSYATARKAILVDLSDPLPQHTAHGTDLIRGVENLQGGKGHDRLTGDTGDNVIDGMGGRDRINGGAGADVILGGKGRDWLNGGVDSAADTFVFRDAADSRAAGGGDRVVNFSSGIDHIDLTLMDADAGLSGHQGLGLSDGPAGHSVWLQAEARGTAVLADVSGDGRADFRVFVLGVVSVDDLIL